MHAAAAAFVLALTAALPLRAADLARFVEGIEPALLVPGGERLGPPDGDPPAAPAYGPEGQLGWVILNTDFVDANGFTGRPVRILIGLDRDGAIVGARLVEHRDGNLRTGVPEANIVAFLAGLVERGGGGGAIDALSGATISADVMRASVRRASQKFARLRGLRGGTSSAERLSLADLTGARLLAHRIIADRHSTAYAAAPFLELWAVAVGPDEPGFLLLDADDREALLAALAPGERAVLIGAGGWAISGDRDYSAGSIIDGVTMIAGGRRLAPRTVRRDLGSRLLPAGEAAVLLFADTGNRLEVRLRQVVDLTTSRMLWFDLALPAAEPAGPGALVTLMPAALLALAAAAAIQWRRSLARRRWAGRLRLVLLLASVLIIGGLLKAPLSATAVLAAASAGPQAILHLGTASTALGFLLLVTMAALPLVGRGLYCGWLCPFGAAQELLARLGRLWRPLRHRAALAARLQPRRRWSLAVLGLLATAWLLAPAIAPALGEVEPFNTVFVLRLDRPWPYLVYPLLLLGLALVMPRPFCRWLCPFGALLSLLGRDPQRLLHRPAACPSWCQRCVSVCPAGAIRSDNSLDARACVLCLRCSEEAGGLRCPRRSPQTDGGYSRNAAS